MFLELTWKDVIDRSVHVFQYALAVSGSDVLTHHSLRQERGTGHFSLTDSVTFSGKPSEEETRLFFLSNFIVHLGQQTYIYSAYHFWSDIANRWCGRNTVHEKCVHHVK